ncbi:MAG: SDR family oxidoreductase [Gammaproteobacteria bacterium]|nr:SDR family oxidoreductase [Gammaproteobacteria bacterium]
MAMLENKRALVIGAASGIGRETACLFAREGADVVVADIQIELGQETCGLIQETGRKGDFVGVDVTDQTSVDSAVAHAAEFLGGIDVLVVTPFVGTAPVLMGLTQADWDRQISVMATGTLFAFQAVIPQMQKQGSGGSMIATSSAHFADYGAMTHPAIIPGYGSGKAAVELLVRSTATLHSPEGIRVNAVMPGFTITPGAVNLMKENGVEDLAMIEAILGHGMPMGSGKPEDVAEGFLFLASDYASYVTGYSLPVDGGSLAGAYGKLAP